MSSGSESDDEYVPGEPEQLSEEESANEETDLQFEKELENKSIKRKSKQSSKTKKKIKIKNGNKEIDDTKDEEIVDNPVKANPEEEKKREDDLWAKFLEGTDTKPKQTITDNNKATTKELNKSQEPNKDTTTSNNIKEDNRDRESRIFEFAGETIVVENNVIKEKIKTSENATISKLDGPSRSRGGGLSNVLGQLHKKNKLSTLEKSKLDWDTYKKEEQIEEEIVNHNKGKAGFLDRRDFLERTDVRQYEIERNLRMNRRSNR